MKKQFLHQDNEKADGTTIMVTYPTSIHESLEECAETNTPITPKEHTKSNKDANHEASPPYL